MAHAPPGEEEEEEGDRDFPAELDEFLEFCVIEHEGDWDAISREFLEVASELEAGLVERAQEVFSAEGLQKRWRLLQDEAEPESKPEPAPRQEPAAPTTKKEPPTAASPPTSPLPVWADPTQAGQAPSDFSVLTDSLQHQVRQIYDNVQQRLPSTLTRQDDEESERVSMPGGFTSATSGDEADGSEADSLGGTAIRLFGSADMGLVVAELSKADSTVTRATSYDAASTARGGRDTETDRDHGGDGHGEEDSSGDDSVDQDFQEMRKALKVSSQRMAQEAPPFSRKSPAPKSMGTPESLRPAPKATVGPGAAHQGPTAPAAGGFVRLELMESSEEELEADDEDEVDSESSSNEEQDSHLRVLNRLLRSAPEGNCPWDAWLEALRGWPQLKGKLNSPDFSRKGSDLRVQFDVDLLKRIIEEEKTARADAREKRRETRDNMPSRIEEFIQEAERQRELMKHRLGSFVLTPANAQLEEALRRQKASREARAKERAASNGHHEPAKPAFGSQRVALHANPAN